MKRRLGLFPRFWLHNLLARVRWQKDCLLFRMGWLSESEFARRCGFEHPEIP